MANQGSKYDNPSYFEHIYKCGAESEETRAFLYDLENPTHVNVQQAEYWCKHFAKHGYFRCMAQEFSKPTLWTMCFMRETYPLSPSLKITSAAFAYPPRRIRDRLSMYLQQKRFSNKNQAMLGYQTKHRLLLLSQLRLADALN